MRVIQNLIGALLLITAAQPAAAYIELNGFYYSDSLSTSSTNSTSNMIAEASIGFGVDKKLSYLIGWDYSMISITRTATSSVKYTASQMGPRFIWRIGKDQNWSLGLGYYLIANAKDNGNGAVEWSGSAYKIDFGYSFDIGNDLQLGVRGNYSQANYNQQLSGGSNYTKISFSRTETYPSLYLIWIW